MDTRYDDIWFRIIKNGTDGIEFPLSVEPSAFHDNMGNVESDVAAALLEQDAVRMIGLARYLRARAYSNMDHDEAIAYRDYVMSLIRHTLEVS